MSSSYQKLFDRNPIVIHIAFINLTGGDVTTALLLQHLSTIPNNEDGEVSQSYEQLQAATHLGVRSLNRSRGLLVKYGFVTERRHGVPPQLYYRINYELLDNEIKAFMWNDMYVSIPEKQSQGGQSKEGFVRFWNAYPKTRSHPAEAIKQWWIHDCDSMVDEMIGFLRQHMLDAHNMTPSQFIQRYAPRVRKSKETNHVS